MKKTGKSQKKWKAKKDAHLNKKIADYSLS